MHETISHKCFEIERESFLSISVDVDELSSFEKAMHSPSSDKWLATMEDEMNFMAENRVKIS